MLHYKDTYKLNAEHQPIVFEKDGQVIPRYSSHIWAILVTAKVAKRPKDPWDGIGNDETDWILGHDKNRSKMLELTTKPASKFFHYSKTHRSRFLTVDGAKKLRLQDMAWVSAFINITYSQDCGFFCGLYSGNIWTDNGYS